MSVSGIYIQHYLTATAISLLLLLMSVGVQARAPLIPSPPQLAGSAWILVDATTGTVIVEHNADQQLPPASLTKMMTSYLVAEEIENSNIHYDDKVTISEKAWRKGGSKMFVEVGDQVAVEELIKGVVIQSGNDASIALAEHVAGSEDAFADIMNQQAELLQMKHSNFKNATGWPEEGHLTTARDLSLLARALINDHPDHYKIYAEKYFTYNEIKQPNRNKLLWRDKTVDGIKTGHTEEAGFCLVASAEKNGMRLISVVMGTNSEESRAVESQKLLTYGFRYYDTVRVFDAGKVFQQNRVWGGAVESVDIGLDNEVVLTIPRNSKDLLKATLETDNIIRAPVDKGQELGSVVLKLEDKILFQSPVIAMNEIPQAGFFQRVMDSIKLMIHQMLQKQKGN